MHAQREVHLVHAVSEAGALGDAHEPIGDR
jgi:hypothetical protein